MIDIPRIRAFLTAAECLNFTEAARRLYITQPTLSKQISLIEDDLGFKLFVRSNRNVSLTAEGAFLYERMRAAVDELDSAVLLARTAGRGGNGCLRIGCFETLCGEPRFLKLCTDFMALCPQAELQVDFYSFARLREMLSDGDLDVIITKEFEANVILDATHAPLFFSEPVVAVGAQHPLAGLDSLQIEALRDYPFISISPKESLGAYNQLYSCCNVGNFSPNIERYVDKYSALFLYLALENDAAILDRCDLFTAPPSVRAIPLKDFSSLATVAVWKRSNHNPCLAYLQKILQRLETKNP